MKTSYRAASFTLRAALLMLLGAAMAGTLPLVGRQTSEINGLLIIGLAGIVALPVHAIFIPPQMYKTLLSERKFLSYTILGGSITGVGYGFFAFGIQGDVNPYTATVLFELNIFTTMVFAGILVRKIPISRDQLAWLTLTFIGILLLAFDSQAMDYSSSENKNHRSIFFILISVFMMGLGSGLIQRGMRFIDTSFSVGAAAGLIGRLGGIIFSIPIGLYLQGGVSVALFTSDTIFWIFFAGIFTIGLSNLLYYGSANMSDSHLVNNFWAMIPVFGLLYLSLAGEVGFSLQIVLGAAFILASNILISVESRMRISFIVAILAVIIFGTLIVFVDGSNGVDFFDTVSTGLLFYVLIFGVAITREERALDREIECSADILAKCASEDLLVNRIQLARWLDPDGGKDGLSTIIANQQNKSSTVPASVFELRMLRRSGASLPEIFVLISTGVLTSIILVLYRPMGFMYDAFSIVMISGIMFLLVFLLDVKGLRRKMGDDVRAIIRGESESGFVTIFDYRTESDRRNHRIFAISLMISLLLIFVGVLYSKYYYFYEGGRDILI